MEEVYIFGHKNPDTDSILSSLILEGIEKTKGINNVKAYRLGEINKETQYVLDYFKIKAPELLEEVEEGQKVMLVDHNEFDQSVKGIEKAEIIQVIDHHNITTSFKTGAPIFYLAMPVGSTATLLYELCKATNIGMDKTTAGLIVSSIISDTLLFKSPTCTEKDKDTALKLAKIAGIDVNKYGIEMLKAGTDLSEFSPKDLINIDSKTIMMGDKKCQIAQVNTVSIPDVLENKVEIERAMQDFINQNGIELFVLMITDILENNSEIIVLGEQAIVEKAFNVELEDNIAFLPGVVSRKKQIVPIIEKFLN